MKISLAPMEGLIDDIMRDVLTSISDVDWCVTEFIRVTDTLLPPRSFHRVCPELLDGAHTRAGVPVRVQLLGSDPGCLAENAARAVELGAPVVDLNFGCPAKSVNRHRGGAVLLKEPELLRDIVEAVRGGVPKHIPVTGKMRLGYEDTSLALDCARAIQQGGASELVVHARTKLDGYRPPAHWQWIARISAAVSIPVIANGEIWCVEDYLRCRAESGCENVMLGRGLVARPDLARQIRAKVAGEEVCPLPWAALKPALIDYYRQVREKLENKQAPGRLKQWLGLLLRTYPEAKFLFQALRLERDADRFGATLIAACND